MRPIFPIAAAGLVALAASAAPPATPGPAVTIANTPLPVVESAIPFDAWGAEGGFPPVTCTLRRIQGPALQTALCESSPFVAPGRLLVRSVSIAPYPVDAYLDDPYRAAGCTAQLLVSIDDQPDTRFPAMSWSPGHYLSSFYVLPVPLEIPAGASIVRRVALSMWFGSTGQGCGVQVRMQVSRQ